MDEKDIDNLSKHLRVFDGTKSILSYQTNNQLTEENLDKFRD